MDSKNESEIVVYCYPIGRIYKAGRIDRLAGNDIVLASLKPQNGVVSKDVVYSPENNLSVRLFIPQKTLESVNPHQKLPVLVYFHGGAFIIESPFSPIYHNYLTDVAAAAKCVAVSVQYRRAPENPIPIPYEDSWVALKWVWSHSDGTGPEEWINRHAGFSRMFLAGDSAGGNIANHVGLKSGVEGDEIPILGIFLASPSFWTEDSIDEQEIKDESMRDFYRLVRKLVSSGRIDGNDEALVNHVRNKPSLAGIGCRKVFVMLAEKDSLVRQGLRYVQRLKESGWRGELEVFEAKGEDHVFHHTKRTCETPKSRFRNLWRSSTASDKI